tara:strand:+ start:216 stop:902 length:687 start_codon:yes stop_codon:yes gene_type:complete
MYSIKSKIFLVLSLTVTMFLTYGCSLIPTNNIAPGYPESYQAIKNAIFGFPDNEISPSLVNNIPYASMLLKIGKGPSGLLILESKSTDGRYTWLSADGVYIVTKEGRIVSTRGLPNNLINQIIPIEDFAELLEGNKKESKYYYSFDKPILRNLDLNIKYEKGKLEEVDILGQKRKLKIIYEVGRNDYLGWNFKNKYWIDEENFVWKSEQSISPKLPVLQIEITKKPSL